MFGIQCESCQKYITGKVLEVTLQLVPAPKVPSADVSTGPPRLYLLLLSDARLGDSFAPSGFLSDVLIIDHPGRMEGVGLFFNDLVSLSQYILMLHGDQQVEQSAVTLDDRWILWKCPTPL